MSFRAYQAVLEEEQMVEAESPVHHVSDLNPGTNIDDLIRPCRESRLKPGKANEAFRRRRL